MILHLWQQELVDQLVHYDVKVKPFQDMLTLEVPSSFWWQVCQFLAKVYEFPFDQLSDLCGVDYLDFGKSDWKTQDASSSGFSRSRSAFKKEFSNNEKKRFAVVAHLLSLSKRRRLRLKVFLNADSLTIPSVTNIWPAVNWFERETFDMFGIYFEHHPDLRRILTDYGFSGHPLRKDFPLIGEVEVRYDATQEKVVQVPVEIQERILIPKVIRHEAPHCE